MKIYHLRRLDWITLLAMSAFVQLMVTRSKNLMEGLIA